MALHEISSQGVDFEIAYATVTSNVTLTSSTEATPTDIISLGAVYYTGAPIWLEFFAPNFDIAAGNLSILFYLWDTTSTEYDRWADWRGDTGTGQFDASVYLKRKITPTAGSHNWMVRGTRSGASNVTMNCGAGGGGSGTYSPIWMRASLA